MQITLDADLINLMQTTIIVVIGCAAAELFLILLPKNNRRVWLIGAGVALAFVLILVGIFVGALIEAIK